MKQIIRTAEIKGKPCVELSDGSIQELTETEKKIYLNLISMDYKLLILVNGKLYFDPKEREFKLIIKPKKEKYEKIRM